MTSSPSGTAPTPSSGAVGTRDRGLVAVAVLLASTALFFVPMDALPTFDSGKATVMTFGLAILAALEALRGRDGSNDPVAGSALLLVPVAAALMALGLALAAGPRGSLDGPLLALAAFAVARRVALAPDATTAFRWVARGACAAGVLAGAYAVIQATGLDPAPWGHRRDATGTFGNIGFAGSYQAATLPLGVVLACAPGGRRADRLLGGLGAAFAITHLLLAQARIDLIAAGAALSVLGFHWLHARGRGRTARRLGAVAMVGALGLAWLFVQAAGDSPPEWLGNPRTVRVRLEIWSALPEMLRAVPLWLPQGTPFVDLYADFRSLDEYMLSSGRTVMTPHNDILALLVSLGLAGLFVVLPCASRVFRRLRPGAACSERPARAAFSALLAALAVSALASSPLTHPSTAFLGATAWGAALLFPRPVARSWSPPRRAVDTAIAVALGAAALGALATFRADTFVALARTSHAEGRTAEALAAFDDAARTDARAYDARYELGVILLNLGEGETATDALRSAHEIRPRSPNARAALSLALLSTGRTDDACALLSESLERIEWDPELRTANAQFALSEGRYAEAARDLERALAVLPDDPRRKGLLAEAQLAARHPSAYDAALGALAALAEALDSEEIARRLPRMIERDPMFLGVLITSAKRRAATEPDLAALLVTAAALHSSIARRDAGFLTEAAGVLAKTGRAPAARILTGRSYGIRAADALADGRPATTLELVAKALERDPTSDHYLTQARALARLGETEDAVDAISSAIAQGPVDPAAVRADADLSTLLPHDRLGGLLERAGQRWSAARGNR